MFDGQLKIWYAEILHQLRHVSQDAIVLTYASATRGVVQKQIHD